MRAGAWRNPPARSRPILDRRRRPARLLGGHGYDVELAGRASTAFQHFPHLLQRGIILLRPVRRHAVRRDARRRSRMKASLAEASQTIDELHGQTGRGVKPAKPRKGTARNRRA
jgi:hypothetical protein